jgi:hypothetical protein
MCPLFWVLWRLKLLCALAVLPLALRVCVSWAGVWTETWTYGNLKKDRVNRI